ncbi:MAG: hypothetical protein WBA17_01030 [Saprospiraceae bacterium]
MKKHSQEQIIAINKAFYTLNGRSTDMIITNRVIIPEDIYSISSILKQYEHLKHLSKLLEISIQKLVDVIATAFDKELLLTSNSSLVIILGGYNRSQWKGVYKKEIDHHYKTTSIHNTNKASFIIHKKEEKLGVIIWI